MLYVFCMLYVTISLKSNVNMYHKLQNTGCQFCPKPTIFYYIIHYILTTFSILPTCTATPTTIYCLSLPLKTYTTNQNKHTTTTRNLHFRASLFCTSTICCSYLDSIPLIFLKRPGITICARLQRGPSTHWKYLQPLLPSTQFLNLRPTLASVHATLSAANFPQ